MTVKDFFRTCANADEMTIVLADWANPDSPPLAESVCDYGEADRAIEQYGDCEIVCWKGPYYSPPSNYGLCLYIKVAGEQGA